MTRFPKPCTVFNFRIRVTVHILGRGSSQTAFVEFGPSIVSLKRRTDVMRKMETIIIIIDGGKGSLGNVNVFRTAFIFTPHCFPRQPSQSTAHPSGNIAGLAIKKANFNTVFLKLRARDFISLMKLSSFHQVQTPGTPYYEGVCYLNTRTNFNCV